MKIFLSNMILNKCKVSVANVCVYNLIVNNFNTKE